MKNKIAHLVLISFLSIAANYAQRPVKENFITYLNAVIPPPVTCMAAFDKIKCNLENCSAEILFKELTDNCEAKLTAINTPDGTNNDMMKKMQDPEFQKKLQNMSDEEKMKFGMEMAKQYQSQNSSYVPETESVMAALEECNKIDERTAQDLQNVNQLVEKQVAIHKEFEERQQKINDWLQEEIEKLPLIKTQVDLARPDPVKVKQLQLQAADKHIAVENEYLKIIGQNWNAQITEDVRDFSKFENLLAKTHYGDDARNAADVHLLASHQAMILNKVLEAASKSKDAYEDAAIYIAEKINLQKQ